MNPYSSVIVFFQAFPGWLSSLIFSRFMASMASILPIFASPQRSKLDTPLKVDWIVLLCCHHVLTGPLPPQ